jgi:hypothetical protein
MLNTVPPARGCENDPSKTFLASAAERWRKYRYASVANRREDLRACLKGIQVEQLNSNGEYSRFCCDDSCTVIGASRSEATSMGRFQYFFGAVIVNEPEELLRNVAVKFGAPVVVKSKKRRIAK